MNALQPIKKYYPDGFSPHLRLLNRQVKTFSNSYESIKDFSGDKVPLNLWSSFYLEIAKLFEAFFKFCIIIWPPREFAFPLSDTYLESLAPEKVAQLAKHPARNRKTIYEYILNRSTGVLKKDYSFKYNIRAFYQYPNDARLIFFGAEDAIRTSSNYGSEHPIWGARSQLSTLIEANCLVASQDTEHPWKKVQFFDNFDFGRIWDLYKIRNIVSHFNNNYRINYLRQTPKETLLNKLDIEDHKDFALASLPDWLELFHETTPPSIFMPPPRARRTPG